MECRAEQEHGEASCTLKDYGGGPVQPGSAWVVLDIIHVLRKSLLEYPFESCVSDGPVQLHATYNYVKGTIT